MILGLPIQRKLEASSYIDTTGLNFMLKNVQGLENAIFVDLWEAYVYGEFEISQNCSLSYLLL